MAETEIQTWRWVNPTPLLYIGESYQRINNFFFSLPILLREQEQVAQHLIFASPLQRGNKPIENRVKWKCKHLFTITSFIILFLAFYLILFLPTSRCAIFLFSIFHLAIKLDAMCLGIHSLPCLGAPKTGVDYIIHIWFVAVLCLRLRDTQETRNQCKVCHLVAIHSIKSSCVSLLSLPPSSSPCWSLWMIYPCAFHLYFAAGPLIT